VGQAATTITPSAGSLFVTIQIRRNPIVPAVEIAHIDHVAIAVRDVERSVDWYRDVLGLERRHPEWGSMPAMVCAGETCVALFPVAGQPSPAPGRDAIAMRHLAFRVDRAGFERAQEELRERGIGFELMDHETAHSVYFEDPDGHRLEITTYELGSWEPMAAPIEP
jgi:catechol 2,3-dioxygenase-like lactoylglutathione lyase family enzyme